MSLMIKETLMPQLGFGSFTTEWTETKLSNIAERVVQKNKEDNQNVLTISAQHGLVNQVEYFNRSVSANDVTSYYLINKNDFAYNKSYSNGYPMGAIKRLTRYDIGVVSTLYICFRMRDKVLAEFAEHYFESGKQNIELAKVAQEGARNHGLLNIAINDFFSIKLKFPSIEEQSKIACFFQSIDEKINGLQIKIDELVFFKKAAVQKILSKEIQFKDQQGNEYPEWEVIKLGKLTKKTSKKNKDAIPYPIYSINNKEGFVPQGDQFEGMDSNSRGYDISMYKIIEPNTFAYNPARINVGSIGYSGDLNNVIISSLYVCFKTTQELDDEFLLQYMDSYEFNKAVLRSVEGGVRDYLFFENFSGIKIPLPTLEEQKKIASFLKNIDQKIIAEKLKLEQAKEWKKGLLQKMFV